MAWVRHRFVRSASGAISNILRKKATPTGSRGLLATRPHVRVTSSAVCAESAITQTRSYAETTGGGWMRTNSRKSGELSEVCSQTELGFGTGLKTSAWVLVGRRSRNMCSDRRVGALAREPGAARGNRTFGVEDDALPLRRPRLQRAATAGRAAATAPARRVARRRRLPRRAPRRLAAALLIR